MEVQIHLICLVIMVLRALRLILIKQLMPAIIGWIKRLLSVMNMFISLGERILRTPLALARMIQFMVMKHRRQTVVMQLSTEIIHLRAVVATTLITSQAILVRIRLLIPLATTSSISTATTSQE